MTAWYNNEKCVEIVQHHPGLARALEDVDGVVYVDANEILLASEKDNIKALIISLDDAMDEAEQCGF